MKRERPRCEDCIYNDNYNEDVPCGAKIGEPIEYCFRPKEADNMKKNKLFDECLSKVDPDIRAEVRRNMNFALIGLPTDEEIQDEAIKHPSPANYQGGAKWMRDIAAQKIKGQKSIDESEWKNKIDALKKWLSDDNNNAVVNEGRMGFVDIYDLLMFINNGFKTMEE